MQDGLNNLIDGIGKAVDKVPEIYDDGLKPATQESGKTLSLIPRTINAALAPLRQWIAQKEYNVAETEKLLAQKLENIDQRKIVTPEPYVAVPAMQAISYSMNSQGLRDLYANLLAKSMNADTKDIVHPAFVEIIKQLSPLDARILNIIFEEENFPVVELEVSEYTHDVSKLDIEYLDLSGENPIRTFTAKGITIIDFVPPKSVLLSLDNLLSLKLINEAFSSEPDAPKSIKMSASYQHAKSELHKYLASPFFKYQEFCEYLQLSTLGKSFHKICVSSI